MKEEKKGFISIHAEPTTVRDTVILSITTPPNQLIENTLHEVLLCCHQ